jgi:integrase
MAKELVELTERNVRTLPAGRHFDKKQRGLLVDVTATCATYRTDYVVRASGRQRRVTLGRVENWTLAAARIRAAEVKHAADLGNDPQGDLEARRGVPTLTEVIERYLKEWQKPGKASAGEERAHIRQWLLPEIGALKANALTRADVIRLHRKISERTPVRANRVKATLSVIFKAAIDAGILTSNPCQGVKSNPETPKKRYLDAVEITRLTAVLDGQRARGVDQVALDAVEFLLATGARRSELLRSKWRDINLATGRWNKPAPITKPGKEHEVPLSAMALALLQNRPVAHHPETPLFPLGRTLKACEDRLDRVWHRVRQEAGLDGTDGLDRVRLHDLRHSFASVLVNKGLDLYLVGKMLGHSKPSTTARYAHLAEGPQRAAAEIMGNAVRPNGTGK